MSRSHLIKSFFQVVLATLFVGWLIWFFSRPGEPLPLETRGEVRLPDGTVLNVEIADTPTTIEQGLSRRRSLPENDGMLFVFPEMGRPIFWMKDMKFSLDILWLNGGTIVDRVENAPPYGALPPIKYFPEADADRVLEIPAGTFVRHNLKVGDHLDIQLTEGYTFPR